jgi:osmoprotectant transport system substrate-binding protein
MSRWMAVAAFVMIAAACGGSDADSTGPVNSDGVRIASFDFAESQLLAELYAQVVEGSDIPVVRLGPVGPREVVAPALEGNVVDLVPEYLGTASGHFDAVTTDPTGLATALEPRGLLALTPASAEDVNVFVVTRTLADQQMLMQLSDLASLAPTAKFGGPVECPERPLCLQGLADTYGLTFAEFIPQQTLEVTAEALRQGEIDIGLMFSTSAELEPNEFVALADDRDLQPPENIVPVVRSDAVERWGPTLPDSLDSLSRLLTTGELRGMNRRVADGEPVAVVAGSWLTAVGLH